MTQPTLTPNTTRRGRLVVSLFASLFAVACATPSGSGGASEGTGGRTGAGGTGGGGNASETGGNSAGGGRPGTGGGSSGGSAGTTAGAGGGTAAIGCDWSSPEGRVLLFDGTTLDAWQNSNTAGAAHWRIESDGALLVVPANPSANLQTKMKFDDLCLHVEYQTPMDDGNVSGASEGNSGIYLRRSYEMQVLDSYGQRAAIGGCGAVYGVSPPLVVACHMPTVWNTYEIEFKAARWDASGGKTSDASFVLVTLNGTVVQRNVELRVSSTAEGQPDMAGPQALMLQDHGDPVRFRNIWAKVPRY
jgi:hypothetical protein